MGNISNMMQLWPAIVILLFCGLSTLSCCVNARYAFRLIVYKYARVL